MSLYYSEKQRQFVKIGEMHTQHIMNAVDKIRRGEHDYYGTWADYKLIELLVELESRNEKELKDLKEQVASLGYRAQVAERQIAVKEEQMRDHHDLVRDRLTDLRYLALTTIRHKGMITADALRSVYERSHSFLDLPKVDIGPYLPFVFRDKRFKKIGFLRSTFPSNKGRYINVWGATAAL